jgi:hypothetical protein
MKKLLLAAFLFMPSAAWAQCTGVFPNNTYCGNISGIPAPPGPITGNITYASVKNYGASGSATTTTGTISSSSTSLSIASAGDWTNGQGILVNHAGAAFSGSIAAPTSLTVTPVQTGSLTATTSYCYAVASVDNAGGVGAAATPVCIANGVAILGQHGAVAMRALNGVTWTNGANTSYTAVWRNQNAGAYCLIAVLSANGHGIVDLGAPCITTTFWLPTSPPVSALADWLQTSIVSGGGSTTLTLQDPAITAASGVYVQHDDTAAITNAANANPAIFFPPGQYNITSIQFGNSLQSMIGAGADVSIINGANGVDTFFKGFGNPTYDWAVLRVGSGFKLFSTLTVQPVAPTAVAALEIYNSTSPVNPVVRDSKFSGSSGVLAFNTINASIGPNNVVTNWYGEGFSTNGGSTNTHIHNNYIGPMGGEIGGFYANNPTSVGGSLVGIGIANNSDHTLTSNNTVSMGGQGVFGITNGGIFGNILDNFVECATHENIAAAGGTGSHVKVSGNFYRWSGASSVGSLPANCTSDDYGMSAADDGSHPLQYIEITNNYTEGSWASAIEIGQGSGGANPEQWIIVSNNTIQAGGTAFCGAIQIEGSNISNVMVGPNNFINTSTQFMVCEVSSTNANKVFLQNGAPGTTGSVKLTGAASQYMTRPTLVNGPNQY